MEVKVATTIAINLVHIVDLIELLDTNILIEDVNTNISEDRKLLLKGQIMLARKATSKIIEILDHEGVQ